MRRVSRVIREKIPEKKTKNTTEKRVRKSEARTNLELAINETNAYAVLVTVPVNKSTARTAAG